MSGTIYSGRYRIGSSGSYTGITLAYPDLQNPTTLTGYVYANTGPTVLGQADAGWTVSNQGLLIGGSLAASGFYYNTITYPGGIKLQSGGLVINGNTGYDGQGRLSSAGSLSADGRIETSNIAIAITGGAGTVVNYGAVTASVGVSLSSGGTLFNGSASDALAYIAGPSVVSGAPGTVINYASLGGGSPVADGIDLLAGGFIQNLAGAMVGGSITIAGQAGSLSNAGAVGGPVTFEVGGTVINQPSGQLSYGLSVYGGAGYLINAGVLRGPVTFGGSGMVTNTGTLAGGTIALGIAGSGTLVNGQPDFAGALIAGTEQGVTIGGSNALATNYGTIESLAGYEALLLAAGGTALNDGLLLESGGDQEVAAAVMLPGGGTLTNNATVSGTPFGVQTTGGTVLNNALIMAQGNDRASAIGVDLDAALLSNTANILVSGQYASGALLTNAATSVNSGLISAKGVNTRANAGALVAVGEYLLSGGTVLNSGTIVASLSGISGNTTGTLDIGLLATGTLGILLNNSGSIIGTDGVVVERSENVGFAGIYQLIDPKPDVTLDNSGLIEGSGGTAVQFGDGNNLLRLRSGAVIAGAIRGGTGTNTIEFASGSGTLTGFGGEVTGFGTIEVDSGAAWTLAGVLGAGVSLTNDGTILVNGNASGSLLTAQMPLSGQGTVAIAGHGTAALLGAVGAGQTVDFLDLVGTLELASPASFAGTIGGFAKGDAIVLVGKAATGAAYATGQLTVSNAGSIVATLALAKTYAGANFTVRTDSAGDSVITTDAACFAAGTRLRTRQGDIAVEALELGSTVLTTDGDASPVIWLGRRRIDCAVHPHPEQVRPIRILAGAFAPELPERDLRLSPDHAVAWESVLIPIRYLVNGMTIRQEPVDHIEYWHVELPRHSLILAEGLPTESYLDTGNRAQFEGESVKDLHPDLSGGIALVLQGPQIVQAKSHLLARAALLGWRKPPAFLQLEVNGRRLAPTALCGEQHRFLLPRDAGHAAIVSHVGVPAEHDPCSQDRRSLGVCIAAVVVDGRSLPLDGPALGDGFFGIEAHGREKFRWTNGRGIVHLPKAARVLELRAIPR